jgi:hypothetical protein
VPQTRPAPSPYTLAHALAALRDRERALHAAEAVREQHARARGHEPPAAVLAARAWHGGRWDLLERLLKLLGGEDA